MKFRKKSLALNFSCFPHPCFMLISFETRHNYFLVLEQYSYQTFCVKDRPQHVHKVLTCDENHGNLEFWTFIIGRKFSCKELRNVYVCFYWFRYLCFCFINLNAVKSNYTSESSLNIREAWSMFNSCYYCSWYCKLKVKS